ncbi:hypothetical protein Alg130_05707 [Pyrenophora tritici-repentis]|nr:hypothetical protein Alg130_05707 [Pyrenophora tritici-repentis]KAI0588416.1 hypothetical protein Alg215_00854 [Pyrenophora tritici-repentis]
MGGYPSQAGGGAGQGVQHSPAVTHQSLRDTGPTLPDQRLSSFDYHHSLLATGRSTITNFIQFRLPNFYGFLESLSGYWGHPEKEGWTVDELKGLKSVAVRYFIREPVQGQSHSSYDAGDVAYHATKLKVSMAYLAGFEQCQGIIEMEGSVLLSVMYMCKVTWSIEQAMLQEEQDKITSLNQTNSPLLRLPSELRNRIFDYVYTDAAMKPDKNAMALPLTCRQLNHETAILPYKYCVFSFALYKYEAVAFTKFLDASTKAQLCAIESIEWVDQHKHHWFVCRWEMYASALDSIVAVWLSSF